MKVFLEFNSFMKFEKSFMLHLLPISLKGEGCGNKGFSSN